MPLPTHKICGMIPKGDNRIIVVLPLCDRDVFIGTKNLRWMAEMDGVNDFDALVSQDSSTYPVLAAEFIEAARKAFRSVTVFKYPMAPETSWPYGANWAFQSTAWHMMNLGRPWFWLESDCIPLKPGWMKRWQEEYDKCGKPMMGPIIKGRGWANGTSVYPANFPDLSPGAMEATEHAWDWRMEKDTIHLTHDANHLFCHVWGVIDGKAHPSEGPAPTFPTQREVDRYIDHNAILFHRTKDGSLIDRLRERRARQLVAARKALNPVAA